MSFDSQGTLYAVDNATDQLLTIDTNTGAGTAIGALGSPIVAGLADNSGTFVRWTISPISC
ncbi:MAG: hypothetical protein R3B91_17455 [Planctomycetaceae bacterium]